MSWEVVSYWVEGHPGLASWVQAFGSIAAILLAIWMSGRESRYRLKIESQARADAIARGILLTDNVRRRVIQALDTWQNGLQTSGLQSAVMVSLDQSLFPLRAFENDPGVDAQVYGHIVSVRHAVEGVLNEFSQVFEVIEKPDSLFRPIDVYQAHITDAIYQLRLMAAPSPSINERLHSLLLKLTK